ncbi:hypothetical protein PC119_g19654 [Phytophthora cactorum]|nr:hypothetical protein PC114_g18435 [Phytophthora cactorum]KAG2987597.1 hypothetical protein PC119_g19654 [Phytophthora cactorum]KAG3064801.1 hypothetical protein PC122_g18408 [Phytophthora cactorum]
MGKRVNVQRTEKERIEFLKKWREHPVWSLEEAARQLKVRPSTLLDWKNRYWSKLDSITGSDRICRKGAGPSRKMTPYEDKVLRYYHVCLRGKGVCRFSELLAYCRGLEEIVLDKPNTHTQETWVERFIAYYSSRATGNYFSRSRGDGDSAEISSGDGDILDECNDITGGGCTNSSGSDSISGGESTNSSGGENNISGGDGVISGADSASSSDGGTNSSVSGTCTSSSDRSTDRSVRVLVV